MGNWHEVKPRPYSPCDGCQMGHCAVSQKTVKGKLYTKTDDCHETCNIYKSHVVGSVPKKEHLFFNNIRGAYAVIKGSQEIDELTRGGT